MGVVAAAGALVLPTRGAIGLLARSLAFLAIPPLLYLTRFPHEQELGQLRRLVRRARNRARRPAGDAA